MRTIIIGSLVASLMSGCNRDRLEEVDEEAERLCAEFYEFRAACGETMDRTEYLDTCTSNPSWTFQDGVCRDEHIAVTTCRMGLTCEEFEAQGHGSTVPHDQQPCAAERRAASTCLAEHR